MSIIIVDGNNLGIASYFANNELTDPTGRPSGAIYGFVRAIRPILVRVQEETGLKKCSIIVAWDGSTCWRKDILPSYKASRGDKSSDGTQELQDYFDQVPRIRDILPMLGVNQVRADHHEADDIAGHLKQTFSKTGRQIVFVTNDKDWYQLVDENTHLWRPLKQSYVTPANFEEETLCKTPEEFVMVKAIAGDKGDDIPGVDGVGEKTALKYLRGEMKPTTKKYPLIEEWMQSEEGFERSKRLVDLREISIPPGNWLKTPGAFDQVAAMETFINLDFNSILKDVTKWLAPFRVACS